jgi:hypothetical protein
MDKRTLEIVKEYINSVAENYSGFTDAYIFGSFSNEIKKYGIKIT